MNIEELKIQRFMRLWQAESRAPLISDVYKDVRIVKVRVELIFESGVLRDPNINKYAREIKPSDKLCLRYECPNKDCTSDGFELTDALRNALSSRVCVEGEIHCTGKEDWKYLRASGCSCMTTLKYRIEPEFGHKL